MSSPMPCSTHRPTHTTLLPLHTLARATTSYLWPLAVAAGGPVVLSRPSRLLLSTGTPHPDGPPAGPPPPRLPCAMPGPWPWCTKPAVAFLVDGRVMFVSCGWVVVVCGWHERESVGKDVGEEPWEVVTKRMWLHQNPPPHRRDKLQLLLLLFVPWPVVAPSHSCLPAGCSRLSNPSLGRPLQADYH